MDSSRSLFLIPISNVISRTPWDTNKRKRRSFVRCRIFWTVVVVRRPSFRVSRGPEFGDQSKGCIESVGGTQKGSFNFQPLLWSKSRERSEYWTRTPWDSTTLPTSQAPRFLVLSVRRVLKTCLNDIFLPVYVSVWRFRSYLWMNDLCVYYCILIFHVLINPFVLEFFTCFVPRVRIGITLPLHTVESVKF